MSKIDDTNSDGVLEFDRNLTYRLSRLQNKLNAQAAQVLRNHDGPTLTDWRILRILNCMKQATLAEMVARSHIDKGQLSRRITALIRDGMIETSTDPDDHRKQILTISKAGQAMHDRVLPAMRARQNYLAADFSEKEYAAFINMLDRINAAADNRDF